MCVSGNKSFVLITNPSSRRPEYHLKSYSSVSEALHYASGGDVRNGWDTWRVGNVPLRICRELGFINPAHSGDGENKHIKALMDCKKDEPDLLPAINFMFGGKLDQVLGIKMNAHTTVQKSIWLKV